MDGAALIRLRMEEEESEHDIVFGSSLCKSFCAGFTFSVRNHRSPNEEGKAYALTTVWHQATEPLAYETGEGKSERSYDNRFACVPASIPFRPARSTRKPVVHGCQTAVVTGPTGEEIYPDSYGRVKVQFHWDREGKRDEN